MTFSELQVEEKSERNKEKERFLVESLRVSKENEAKLNENNRQLIEKYELLLEKYKKIESDFKLITEKYAEMSKGLETNKKNQILYEKMDIEVSSGRSIVIPRKIEKTMEISQKNQEKSLNLIENSLIITKKTAEIPQKETFRRSSTENLDKLLESMLIHQAKKPSSIQNQSKNRSFTSNFNVSQNFSMNFQQKAKNPFTLKDKLKIQKKYANLLNNINDFQSDVSKRPSFDKKFIDFSSSMRKIS